MQLKPLAFTKNDLAKYPFLKETAEYIRPLNLQIEDLTSAGMAQVLKRAEEKANGAIISATTTQNPQKIDLEISSYSVALLVAATGNSFMKEEYALAEARQAHTKRNSTN